MTLIAGVGERGIAVSTGREARWQWPIVCKWEYSLSAHCELWVGIVYGGLCG